MPLFIVRHEHDAERCPATDPYMGATLLNYLSRPTVRAHGIEIHGEAVVQGEHTLYMIVEADAQSAVDEFVKPFGMVGSVDIYPASTCVRVVASGGCGLKLPATEDESFVDPEEACQRAIESTIKRIADALASEDPQTKVGDSNRLKAAIEALDEATQPLADLMMDKAMEAVLRKQGVIQ